MIEVTESSEAKNFATADDALEQLSSLYGRVLRIRSIARDPSYRGKIVDRVSIGRLQSLTVSTYYGELNRVGAMHGYQPAFNIALGSEPAAKLGLLESAVEVLQEDTGKWTLIHRGRAFEQFLEGISK